MTTYVIPVQPVYRDAPTQLRHGAIGVAFNGVQFDPPAPLHAILAAHTIAPLDDSGGHLNPFEGYHYHAATGHTKELVQADGNAPMIGYAMDGFAIHAHLDEQGREPEGLNECGGHADPVRGYHYHAGKPGSNQVFKAFRGIPGTVRVEGDLPDAPGPPGHHRPGPPGGRRDGRPPR
ncbi:MAG: YHYH protein [Planctomycetes bacterium]|nr:YHYH protein [Planctomycetota bacterium]